ncbi:MAG TPA: 50S ribosomal protein L3 [Candidatus Polarisedimenticolaceae bacterium]|nr:50S ribosomal protein L3 [Candidatus Polarisedimenticolaceae bacterium]
MQGMIGRKVGMTQLFLDDGTVAPVTVIEAGPCVVVQRRSGAKDGYEAVQLGLVDAKAAKRADRAMRGHHERAGVPPTRLRREFGIDAGSEWKPGDKVLVDIFDGVPKVDVIATSKGKGFQGVMKRHNFRGGANSHGSMFHRAPGSIGASAFPSRVFKGMRGTGHMGSDRVTVKNLKVVRIDKDKNLLLVRGAVPGAVGAAVLLHKSRAK